MLFQLFSNPLSFIIWSGCLLLAVDAHEFAHALVADKLGDPTARVNGRLTLNPLAHLDPLGTLSLLLVGFGWGKPVPVDSFNFANPRRDNALVSFAGPAANLILAILVSLLTKLLIAFWGWYWLRLLIIPFLTMNIGLAIFNLLPIHPLDGSHILIGLLPKDLAFEIEEILNQYGLMLLLFLLFPLFGGSSLVSLVLSPVVNWILSLLL